VGTYNTSGNAASVVVAGRYAYVADYDAGLQIIDISNPASPTLVGTYNTSGNAWDVAIAGRNAYVSDELLGIKIVDISNPAAPTLIGAYDTNGSAFGIAVLGTRSQTNTVLWSDQTTNFTWVDVPDTSVASTVYKN
jgi:hypothetical protein